MRIEEVSKHVHITTGFDGGNLDAGDGFDTTFARMCTNVGRGSHRVVIGDGDHLQPGCRGAVDELARRAAAV